MTTQMDPVTAAQLLEKWIRFYGMDTPGEWPPEDYRQVKRAHKAMQLAIEILRGNTQGNKEGIRNAIHQLNQWPRIHSMDDSDDWEPEDFPFVQNVLGAIRFTAAFLNEQQTSSLSNIKGV